MRSFLWILLTLACVINWEPYHLGIVFADSQGVSPPVAVPSPPSQLAQGVCAITALNPCLPIASCSLSVPIFGDAICTCPSGFGGDGRRANVGGTGCRDIDECLSGTSTCDTTSEICVNTIGSFRCDCAAGYQIGPDNSTCIDIDECASSRLNSCDPANSVCLNTPGSFICVCTNSSQINDPSTGLCRAINVCTDVNGSRNPCSQKCDVAEDALDVPICSCNPGYTLAEDTHTCVDINECITGEHSCDPSGIISRCINLEGSFRCECNTAMGYQNSQDGRSCINLDECSTNSQACGTTPMCCLDLPPPQRFMCLLPGTEPPTNITNLSVSSGFPVQRANNDVSYSSDPAAIYAEINKLFPGNAYDVIEKNNIVAKLASTGATRAELGTSGVSSTSSAASILQNQCFQYDTVYLDVDILPPIYSVPYAAICQQLCDSSPQCFFFSYDTRNSTCYQKATSFTAYKKNGMISGPQNCVDDPFKAKAPPTGILSWGLTSLDTRSAPLLGVGRRSLENVAAEPASETQSLLFPKEGLVSAELCGGKNIYQRCVVAGSLSTEVIEQLLNAKNDNSSRNVKKFVKTSLRSNSRVMPFKATEEYNQQQRNLLSLGNIGIFRPTPSSPNTGFLRNFRPLSILTGSCPSGYILSSDVGRINRLNQTISLAKSFFVRNINGTATAVDPAEVTQSIVSNTNYLANQFADLYVEAASAPVEVISAAFSGVTPASSQSSSVILTDAVPPGTVPPTPPTVQTVQAERQKVNSALLTTAALFGLLSGSTTGSIPGSSLVADRTGRSSRIAYGFR